MSFELIQEELCCESKGRMKDSFGVWLSYDEIFIYGQYSVRVDECCHYDFIANIETLGEHR